MPPTRNDIGCLALAITGALIITAVTSLYAAVTDFYHQHAQLLFNVLLTVAVTTILAVHAERRWTKRAQEAALASSGMATFIVFLVATATHWWTAKNFSLALPYFVAAVAFLLIVSLLKRFSIQTLRQQPSESADKWWKLNDWKQVTPLSRLGLAPFWPVATAFGVIFYGAKLKAHSNDPREQ